MKLLQGLKMAIRGSLGIELIDKDIDEIYQQMKTMNDAIVSCAKAVATLDKDIENVSDYVENLEETMKSAIKVSTNISHPETCGSWAVVSLKGEEECSDQVHFFNLDGKNQLEITKFLMGFKGAEHAIDSPFKRHYEEKLK